MEWLGSLLKQILRRLGRAPLFTSVTLITLALGVGASAAVFSVVEGVLLKPLAYPHPDGLIGVWHTAPGLGVQDVPMAATTYFVYREENQTFEDIGLYRDDSVSVTGIGEPEQVRALDVTDGTIPILGIPPSLGRSFTRSEDTPEGHDAVILGYGYWRSKFGADPSIIGRSITVNGKLREIIGVMPKQFHMLDWQDAAVILPLQFDRNKIHLGNFGYEGVARLKPGVTLAQADADIARMLSIVMRTFSWAPGFHMDLVTQARMAGNVRPLKHDVVGDVGKLLWILMGSIGMVLLIACANVANLLLVRAEARQQELAIRSALGASWGRIAAEFLLESFVIGLLGCALGLGLAYGALRLLVALEPAGLPRLHEIGLNLAVLLFTLVLSLFAALLFGSVPIFKYGSAHLGTGLREGARTLGPSRERHRARNTLVIVQVALAFVLLVCSGLMIRTFRALTRVNPGFADPSGIQTFRLNIPEAGVSDPEKVVRMQEEILRRVAASPGVSSAALALSVPMDGSGWDDLPVFEGKNDAPGEVRRLRRFNCISPGLFHTLGVPLIAGRDFTWTDIDNMTPVAIVSENLALELWHSPADALGKRVRVTSQDDWREIVGVVGDVHDDGMNEDAPRSAYFPIITNRFETGSIRIQRDLAVVLRSPRAGSSSFIEDAQQAVWTVDANLPLAKVRTLAYFYSKSMARISFTLVMLGIAAAMALVLGTVGLYGVIAYSVLQRTREIGIRAALGAQQLTLVGMFVRHGLVLVGAGLVCGLVVALGAMRLMSSLLFHVSPADPLTYLCVCVGLVAAAALASYIPSRRAANIDPIEALRAE